MAILPDSGTLLAYSIACLVLFATPGPDMSLFLSRTMTGGRAAGLAAMAGAMVGCCVHTVVAALGLSALIAASTTAFTILKVVGALYLLWLAIDAIRRGSALSLDAGARAAPSLWRTFLVGIGINLTNPKVVLFFVTFLPQFVDPHDPHAPAKLFVLGLYFVVLSTPLAALMVLLADRFIAVLTRRRWVSRTLDYAFAGIFAVFAIRIALIPSR
ncbi:LysE family translocator [Enterovirga rhinocerotis]|uniref:Threonine/homoserine/homoserine lactone efflux protein n=1 Tax=Enterovirga rhinocerotis TaxID=1339210 RepID=A0A4R7C3Q9_9HYPH|nr:LysE family translocator [Enterovirga rhinocerotis]TDR93084.1 threonine/homoserine/homoserine lactone efflux protein [Enterovirga rhinocerotis]